MEKNAVERNGMISLREIINSVKDLIHIMKTKFKLIVFSGIIFGLIGLTYAISSKPIYKSHLSFLLNENESSSLNFSSLAGLAGLGGGNLSNGINEDKLLFISSSRFLIGTTLLSVTDLGGKNQILVNYFINKYELMNTFHKDSQLVDFSGFSHTNIDELTIKENKVLDFVIDFIEKKQLLKVEGKKKTGLVAQNSGIINIDFFSTDENFSKVFVDILYNNISKYYVNKVTLRHQKNYLLIKERADSLRTILLNKEDISASLFDRNINLSKMKPRVNIERSRRDLELLNLMYAEVLKNLEISKFNLENQTPLLQIIDKPSFPLKMERKSKIKYTILGGLIGSITVMFAFFGIHLIKINS